MSFNQHNVESENYPNHASLLQDERFDKNDALSNSQPRDS